FAVTTHLLRKSCATDRAWAAGIEDAIRRRFMGHRAGDDVYGRIYTLDHPDVAPLAKVAEILDHNIAMTIETLLTPTLRRVHWGSTNPLAARAAHIDATLAAAGWLVEPGSDDDPLCDAARVAAELDISVTTARRWIADGTLPTVTVPDAQSIPRRCCRLSDLWMHRDRLAGRILLPDLAEQLGLRYHEAYQMLRRLGLAADQDRVNGQYQLSPEAAEALRAEQRRIGDLHGRSVKLAVAARQLGVALSTAALLSRTGHLEVDPESDASGARFVTRGSVQACWLARQRRGRTAEKVEAVAVDEVARFTGCSVREVMDLARAGVLEQLPGRRACQLSTASLKIWLGKLG
ncbi:MAG: hypothetical protein M0010_15515, partial [Actinomycetota bacterium]|nr:hypothetical protein [Actinomycetota bacterium]